MMANNQPMADFLANQTILVTGAGQGLGRVAALSFARCGATVVLHGRDQSKLERVYDEIEEFGGKQPAMFILDYFDATQRDLDRLVDAIGEFSPRLDGLFHAACHFSPLMPLAMQDLSVWQKHLTINLAVPLALSKACLPLMQSSQGGAIVFLADHHMQSPSPYWGPFATAQAGLLHATQTWRAELGAASAVRFHVCIPGPVASPMRQKSHPGESVELLPSANDLAKHFLFLMGEQGRAAPLLYSCRPDGAR